MKSLNRTLSLVLVLAMIFGLMGIASATSFTDNATIQYKEAVDVMTGIGAINGYTDGTFKPTGTITREEAAKLITYAILGPTVAKTLSVSTSSFTDVAASRWSAPYITYLVSKGIINGMGDGTFDPEGNVTGYQLAKMLLCAAGYGKQGEFTGSSWELNVAILGNKLSIFTSSKATSYSTAATREEAALYVFNALTKIEQVVWNNTTESYNAEDGTFSTPVDNTIASDVYPTLAISTTTSDTFGRPATIWVYGVPLKTIAAVTATPVATFTGTFTQAALYTALGEAVTSITAVKSIAGTQTTATLVAAAGNTGTQGGNGIKTEIFRVYTSPTAYTYKAIQIAPSFGTISSIVNTPATSTKGAYTTYTVGGISGKVFSTVVDPAVDEDTAVISGNVAVGDKVLYYNDEAGTVDTLYIEAVSAFSGILSSVSSLGVYTIDGSAYKLAAAGSAPSANTLSQTFYKDSYGYILGTKSATSVTNYAAVIGYKTSYTLAADGTLTPAYLVTVVKTDGTVANLPVSSSEYTNWDEATDIFTLVTYATYVDTTTGATLYDLTAGSAGNYISTLSAITNKANALTVSAPGTPVCKYADASTLFIAVNYNATTSKPTGTVNTYTGIANVPNYSSLTATWAVDTNAVAYDSVANVVFIIDNKTSTASDTYVFLTGTYTKTASGTVLNAIVAGKAATYTLASTSVTSTGAYVAQTGLTQTAFDAAKTDYYTLSGTTYTACTSTSTYSSSTTYYKLVTFANMKGLYSAFTVSNGVVTAASSASAAVSASGTSGIKVSSNLFYTTSDNGAAWAVFSTPYIADATPVYVIHNVSGTVDTATASAITSLTYASAVYVNVVSSTIVAVYVIVAN